MIRAVSPSLNLDQDVYIILTSLSALRNGVYGPDPVTKLIGLRLVQDVIYLSL